ncbi:hypothetical protein JHK85_054794 [Glycine max]|nr:hypothetical protein JHK85_054794 [Glycine max]
MLLTCFSFGVLLTHLGTWGIASLEENNKFQQSQKKLRFSVAFSLFLASHSCWLAASLLKHGIDMKDSLALAKLYLNFDCKKEEGTDVYSELWKHVKEF